MERLYTTEELQEVLKLSSFTIRRKIRNKELIAYKVGKQYLVKESDLIKYFNDLTENNYLIYNNIESEKK